MTDPLHTDELPITDELVRQLVGAQYPQYADAAVRPLGASGSTNRLFRLGDDLLVRMPRQPGGGAAIEGELRWPARIAPRLPVRTPRIVAVGQPGFGYPERWSIVEWIPGELPGTVQAGAPASERRSRLAIDLADVIAALRDTEVPPEARTDPDLRWYRGRALTDFDADFRRSLEACGSIDGLDLDLTAASALWDQALRLPGAGRAGADRWYHGDLVAENLLLTEGRLSAVLDFTAFVGDPTVDLHGAWELLDPTAREVFGRRLGIDEAEWLRGRAWALGIALGTFGYYWTTMPARRRDRLAMARSVLADWSG